MGRAPSEILLGIEADDAVVSVRSECLEILLVHLARGPGQPATTYLYDLPLGVEHLVRDDDG